MAHRTTKPRLLLVKGSGGGPLAEICRSLEKVAEVLLVNVATGSGWLEADAQAAARAVAGGRDAVIPVTDMATAVDTVVAAVRKRPVDAILTPSERDLAFTATLAQELGLLHASPETVATARDKYAQRKALRAGGVPCPHFARIESEADLDDAIATVPMPAVLKPESGAGGVDTYQIADADTLRTTYRQAVDHLSAAGLGSASFIVEELLVGVTWHEQEGLGDYCSVESFILHGEIMHACVTDRTPLASPFRETGCILPSALPPDRLVQVRECAAAAIRALGIEHGVTHTEIKFTAEGPRIIEVNLRVGGHLSYMTGDGEADDMIAETGRLALGETPKHPLDFPQSVGLFFLTPPRSAHPVHVSGLDRLETIPHVRKVIPNPTGSYDWRLGERGDAAFVTATAPDTATLVDVRRQLMETLRFA